MLKPAAAILTSVLLCCLATNLLAQLDHSLPPPEQAAAGQALAQKWRDSVPAESAEYKGALKIRRSEAQTETVPIIFRIIIGQPSWQTIYEAAPTAKLPGQKLIIIHTPGKPNQYLFASGSKPGDPAGQPAPLTNDRAAKPFAGSDFWPSDMGLDCFHWPTQRLLKTEMRAGQVTKVPESRPNAEGGRRNAESSTPHSALGTPNSADSALRTPRSEFAYSRVVTWLEKESGAPILAEAYDRNDKLLKQFSIKHVKKVKGHYQLQEMQIRNAKDNSRTRIEYEFEKE